MPFSPSPRRSSIPASSIRTKLRTPLTTFSKAFRSRRCPPMERSNVALNAIIPRASLGTLTYTPNSDYNGSDSFGWNGSDGTVFAAAPRWLISRSIRSTTFPASPRGPVNPCRKMRGRKRFPARRLTSRPAPRMSRLRWSISLSRNDDGPPTSPRRPAIRRRER